MKIIFTTDLHGNRSHYDQLLEVATLAEADVVVNSGDMLPKDRDLFEQDRFITGFLDQHFQAINDAGIHYLCYPGNDDLAIFDDLFDDTCRGHSLVTNLAQRMVKIGDHEFVGMNWVVDYPFRLKDRCRMDTRNYIFQTQLGTGLLSTPDGWRDIADWKAHAATLPTIEDELKALPRPQDPASSIYVIHMPPYGLGLDECWSGTRVGSRTLSDFLTEQQPQFSLHGHIHESPQVSGKWQATLGRTVCIQPGQGRTFTYVTIDTQTNTVHRTGGDA